MGKDLSSVMILLMAALILLRGKITGTDVYGSFLTGAESGMKAAVRLLPGLMAMMMMIGVLEASGVLKSLIQLLYPLADVIDLPREVMPVVLLRPLTGSGGMAALERIFEICGPDSRASRAASVLMGSNETIFYTMTVYLGAAGIRKLPYILPVSLVSYVVAVFVCGLTV